MEEVSWIPTISFSTICITQQVHNRYRTYRIKYLVLTGGKLDYVSRTHICLESSRGYCLDRGILPKRVKHSELHHLGMRELGLHYQDLLESNKCSLPFDEKRNDFYIYNIKASCEKSQACAMFTFSYRIYFLNICSPSQLRIRTYACKPAFINRFNHLLLSLFQLNVKEISLLIASILIEHSEKIDQKLPKLSDFDDYYLPLNSSYEDSTETPKFFISSLNDLPIRSIDLLYEKLKMKELNFFHYLYQTSLFGSPRMGRNILYFIFFVKTINSSM